MRVMTAALLVALLTAPAAAARNRQDWVPEGKWVVRFDADRCLAVRNFASGDRKLMLGIERTPLTEYSRILFQIPGEPGGMGIDHAVLTIGGVKQPRRVALVAPSATKGFQIISFTATDEQLEALTREPWMQFSAIGKTIKVPVARFAAITQLLDQCDSQLLASWGFSGADQERIATYPKARTNLSNIFTADDYPSNAIHRGAVGQVDVRATIGTDGHPIDCIIVGSSGHQDLDSTTCRLFVKRARFEPGVDRNGKRMAAPVFLTLRWLLP